MLILALLWGVACLLSRVESHCVTYGDCGGLPCVSNTAAKPLGQELSSLRDLCPHLKEKAGYCCDDKQVVVMKSALSKADKLLNGCMTARTNFRSLVCDMVCGPDQANYVQITQTEQYGAETRATHLRYFVSNEYSDRVWRSTRKQNKLLCGNIFRECSKHDLFSFIGDNRWTKLKTDYVIESWPSKPDIQHASHHHLGCGQDYCPC